VARELPTVNGEDPYLRIRQASYLPIIVIGNEEEAAETLEFGADAYMTRPPSLSELVARVHVLLRRKPRYDSTGDTPRLATRDNPGKAEGDEKGKIVNFNGLTPTEFRLASCLVINRGQLLDYPRLIGEVWGGKEVGRDTLHFYMRRLRQKLQDYIPCHILNFQGVGYCLEVTSATQCE
jgi:DNA-binding response OmpR family regulator